MKALETTYDAGYPRVTRDRRGYLTDYLYDAAGRLTRQRDRDAQGAIAYTQTRSYDDPGRTATEVDRNGNTTTRSYDGLGRVEQVQREDALLERYAYDGNGNVVRFTDANDHVRASRHDGANRLVSETKGYGSAVAATTAFRYDRAGNVAETKNARATGVPYDVRTCPSPKSRPIGNC